MDLNGAPRPPAADARPTAPPCGCLARAASGSYAWGFRATATERPATAIEAAAALKDLCARHDAVWIEGAATRLGACPPLPAEAAILSTHALQGVVAFEPGDLTLTVRGGTRLDAVHELLAGHGLELPGAHFGLASGTVGGLLSTGLNDVRRSSAGPLRDRILGMELAISDGRVTHSGGRVVKNVAGYDVGRFVAGAHGSLGVVTEVTLRLSPRPEAHAPFERPFADAGTATEHALALWSEATALGFAAVVADRAGATLVWVHEGYAEAVEQGVQFSERRFGGAREHERPDGGAPVGARLLLAALEHVCPERSNALLRGNVRPQRLAGVVRAVAKTSPRLLGANAGPGAVLARYDLDAPGAVAAMAFACAAIEAAGGTWRVQGAWRPADGPTALPWGGIDVPGELYARLHRAFDATGRLGPRAFHGGAAKAAQAARA
jgi:glycolate oxidase FAD binding subunit